MFKQQFRAHVYTQFNMCNQNFIRVDDVRSHVSSHGSSISEKMNISM